MLKHEKNRLIKMLPCGKKLGEKEEKEAANYVASSDL